MTEHPELADLVQECNNASEVWEARIDKACDPGKKALAAKELAAWQRVKRAVIAMISREERALLQGTLTVDPEGPYAQTAGYAVSAGGASSPSLLAPPNPPENSEDPNQQTLPFDLPNNPHPAP
jgi:hypothetical protein